MRKLIFISFVALGALVGLLSSARETGSTQVVMMAVGALFGAPLGAALASLGRKKRHSNVQEDDSHIPGMGTSPKDLSANYWRDKGHPPFMKPPEAEPDAHMYDPDKLG